MKPGVLYITYDGLLEPLGQSQVLAYLERLADDYRIHLLSFEKAGDWNDREARGRIAARLRAAGIAWHPRRYHKRPSALATAWDIGIGFMTGAWLVWRRKLRIVHARSYVPSVMALALKKIFRLRYLFDMRGFWVDERVDGGLWPRDGLMYRVGKWFERRFLLSADHVVSLTKAAVSEMERFDYLQGRAPPMAVIPTCADLQRFKPDKRRAAAPGFTLGYVGSAGTWYLFDAVARAVRLAMAERNDLRFLVINRNEHAAIRAALQEAGVDLQRVEIRAAQHHEVPDLMSEIDAGIFFYKPTFSRAATAPTKLGEFLGCGVPCLCNAGVGDVQAILSGEEVGEVVDGFDADHLEPAVRRLLALAEDPQVAQRCRRVAERVFSLEQGVGKYARCYRALLGGNDACGC